MGIKGHQRYRNDAGDIVVGTTTVVNLMAKPFLITWANKLGLDGIDSTKYVDNLADIGTLSHYMIECKLKTEPINLKDYSANQIDQAGICADKFWTWKRENKFDLIHSEMQLVSEKYQFGGTLDIYCKLNGKLTLIDIKTSKRVYDNMFTQVAAYANLLTENGHKVEDVRILRIGRDEGEGFDDIKVPSIDLHWKRFQYLLGIYKINKELRMT